MAIKSSALEAHALLDSDDAQLALAAAEGEPGAFEELYRRHSAAALSVARSVTSTSEDAADAVAEAFTRVLDALPRLSGPRLAFRPYLLTTTRHAAHDLSRSRSRVVTSAEPTDLVPAVTTASADSVVDEEDRATMAQAFGTLPERWQAVLWLTEVEGCAPRDAATVLGLTANNVAQLATRARARLRAGYLQAHVGNGVSDGCKPTVDNLGSFVAGTLAAGQTSSVRKHLADCSDCSYRVDELTELAPALRRAVVPLPAGLAALVARLRSSSGGPGGDAGGGRGRKGVDRPLSGLDRSEVIAERWTSRLAAAIRSAPTDLANAAANIPRMLSSGIGDMIQSFLGSPALVSLFSMATAAVVVVAMTMGSDAIGSAGAASPDGPAPVLASASGGSAVDQPSDASPPNAPPPPGPGAILSPADLVPAPPVGTDLPAGLGASGSAPVELPAVGAPSVGAPGSPVDLPAVSPPADLPPVGPPTGGIPPTPPPNNVPPVGPPTPDLGVVGPPAPDLGSVSPPPPGPAAIAPPTGALPPPPAPGLPVVDPQAPGVGPTVAPPTVVPPTVDTPTVGAPTVAPPAVGTPPVNPPTVNAPTVNAPTLGAPTANAPTVEAPTVYAPTVYGPTVYAPTVDAPTVYAPTVYAPTIDAPWIYAPTVNAPTIYAPTVEAPTVYAPTVEAPTIYAPTVEAPTVNAPTVGAPTVNAPTVEAPTVEAPTVEAPTVEAPTVEAPTVDAPTVDAPTVGKAFTAALTKALLG